MSNSQEEEKPWWATDKGFHTYDSKGKPIPRPAILPPTEGQLREREERRKIEQSVNLIILILSFLSAAFILSAATYLAILMIFWLF